MELEKKLRVRRLAQGVALWGGFVTTAKTIKEVPETVKTVGTYLLLYLHYGVAFFGHFGHALLFYFIIPVVCFMAFEYVLRLLTLGKKETLYKRLKAWENWVFDRGDAVVLAVCGLFATWQTFVMKSTEHLDDYTQMMGYAGLIAFTLIAVVWFIPDTDKEAFESKSPGDKTSV